MKPNWLPVALIVVGALLLYQGWTAKRKDTLFNVGNFRATLDRRDRSPVTTLLGGAAVAGGLFLLARSRNTPR